MLFIEVRAMKDLGEVLLPESGKVKLMKNQTYYLRRSEVDPLIKRGELVEVNPR